MFSYAGTLAVGDGWLPNVTKCCPRKGAIKYRQERAEMSPSLELTTLLTSLSYLRPICKHSENAKSSFQGRQYLINIRVTMFHSFAQLPAELRLYISPRLVPTITGLHTPPSTEELGPPTRGMIHIYSVVPVPSILHACRESRH
jgi:hypothetical protein